MEIEALTKAAVLFKYRFWSQFVELKLLLENLLEKNDTFLYSVREKKKYERALNKNSLSCNYMGLVNLYMQIIEKQMEYYFRNEQKDFQNMEFPKISEVSFYVMLLNCYDSPEIPGRLTMFTMIPERDQIKEILRTERESIKGEIITSQMVKYGLENQDWLLEFTSALEPNEKHLFSRTLFTLASIFKTIS